MKERLHVTQPFLILNVVSYYFIKTRNCISEDEGV
jgi:hypothetical protein